MNAIDYDRIPWLVADGTLSRDQARDFLEAHYSPQALGLTAERFEAAYGESWDSVKSEWLQILDFEVAELTGRGPDA